MNDKKRRYPFAFIFGLLFRSHYFLHIYLKIDITYLKFSMELKYKKRLDII